MDDINVRRWHNMRYTAARLVFREALLIERDRLQERAPSPEPPPPPIQNEPNRSRSCSPEPEFVPYPSQTPIPHNEILPPPAALTKRSDIQYWDGETRQKLEPKIGTRTTSKKPIVKINLLENTDENETANRILISREDGKLQDVTFGHSNIDIPNAEVHNKIKKVFDKVATRDFCVDDIMKTFRGKIEYNKLHKGSLVYRAYRIYEDACNQDACVVIFRKKNQEDYAIVQKDIIEDAKKVLSCQPSVAIKKIPVLKGKSDMINVQKVGAADKHKYYIRVFNSRHRLARKDKPKKCVVVEKNDFAFVNANRDSEAFKAMNSTPKVSLQRIPCLERRIPEKAFIFVENKDGKDVVSVKVLKKDVYYGPVRRAGTASRTRPVIPAQRNNPRRRRLLSNYALRRASRTVVDAFEEILRINAVFENPNYAQFEVHEN